MKYRSVFSRGNAVVHLALSFGRETVFRGCLLSLVQDLGNLDQHVRDRHLGEGLVPGRPGFL